MRNSDNQVELADLLDAIQDQSRILIALHEDFQNTSAAAKRLVELGMPPSRVASLLGKPLSHITSALNKARKKSAPTTGGAADVPIVSEGGGGNEA
jgi:hypothetical protein